MDETFAGIDNSAKLTHPAKACVPIVSRVLGRNTCFRPDIMNAPSSTTFNADGRETLLKLVQTSKASLPIVSTPLGMSMLCKLTQWAKASAPTSLREEGRLAEVRLVQPQNTSSTIFITPEGILILCKLVQLAKAPVPIFTKLFGSADKRVKISSVVDESGKNDRDQ